MGTVVKMDDPKDLQNQQNEFERDFSKKQKEYEKTKGKGKGEAKKPGKTGYPEMHYACACPHMRTYRGDIASSTCKDCKARGYVNILENKPDCMTCMCQCQAGVFTMKDINKLAVKRGERSEMKARAKQASSDTRMRESLETIIKSSIQDGIASIKKSSTEVEDENVMSAAAAFMSRKKFRSEEEMHAAQRASTLTTKLKASGKDVREILNASSACKGKRAYRNNLG
jgi:hypothetical protein